MEEIRQSKDITTVSAMDRRKFIVMSKVAEVSLLIS